MFFFEFEDKYGFKFTVDLSQCIVSVTPTGGTSVVLNDQVRESLIPYEVIKDMLVRQRILPVGVMSKY